METRLRCEVDKMLKDTEDLSYLDMPCPLCLSELIFLLELLFHDIWGNELCDPSQQAIFICFKKPCLTLYTRVAHLYSTFTKLWQS